MHIYSTLLPLTHAFNSHTSSPVLQLQKYSVTKTIFSTFTLSKGGSLCSEQIFPFSLKSAKSLRSGSPTILKDVTYWQVSVFKLYCCFWLVYHCYLACNMFQCVQYYCCAQQFISILQSLKNMISDLRKSLKSER